MPWVTKNSTETYREESQQTQYTNRQKAANWWDYHKWQVILGVVGVAAAVWIVKDTVFRTRPDVEVGYVAHAELPVDTAEALTEFLQSHCTDLNGDGKVVVQLNQYTIDFDAESESTDAYYQMAGVTRLSADLGPGGKTYLFLMDDPEGFEEQTGALQYLDGTVPADPNTVPASEWPYMVYRWADCPVLAGADLGTYRGLTVLDDQEGSSQELLAGLYVGRRGVWNPDQVEDFAGGPELWAALTAGATPMQVE